jgi:putative ABC transport system permease protein
MTTIRIAIRNLLRQKRRTYLLGGAIAFGVMVMVLMGSLTAGLNDTANTTFTNMLGGHIYISGREVLESGRLISAINEGDVLEEVLTDIEARPDSIQFRSQASGEIIFGSRLETVSLVGVRWSDEQSLLENIDVAAGNIASTADPLTVILPEPIAEEIGVQVGESVLVRLSTVAGQRNVGEFVVGALIPDGGSFGLSSAYVDRSILNSLIGLPDSAYQQVSMALADPGEADAISEALRSDLKAIGKLQETAQILESSEGGIGSGGGSDNPMASQFGFSPQALASESWDGTRFSISTINDVMEPVVTLTRLLNQVSVGLFVILLTITMVGLLNTFRMILIERTREIGTIRAIGMQRNQVRDMFLVEATFLAVAGAVIGLAGSFVAQGILSAISFDASSAMAVFLDSGHLAFPVNLGTISLTLFLLTGATLFAAYLPARRAAQMRPADALRTSY